MGDETGLDNDINPSHVFDGFCHRPYNEDTDGWRTELLSESDVPSVQMAKDILMLFGEVNALRKENWQLSKRLENESIFNRNNKEV
jgi:hypothetical protein